MTKTKYLCSNCEKYHYRGKIYEKHQKYKKIEDKNQKLYKIKNSAWNKLSALAKKQLLRLADKMNKTKRRDIYRSAISQILEKELDKEDLIPLN